MAPSEGSTRHQARERALSLLYEAELKRISPSDVLAALPVPPEAFAVSLVRSTERHQEQADKLISEASVGWPLDRMAVLDRLVLRLSIAEMLEEDGPPVPVVIDEALELAKEYSTDESSRFLNGILATVAKQITGG